MSSHFGHERSLALTSWQFHALLNSLFRVLFNFPSRYLFSIGLVGIFSLGWSLPPVLAQYFQTTRLSRAIGGETRTRPYGALTLCGQRDNVQYHTSNRSGPPLDRSHTRHRSQTGYPISVGGACSLRAELFPFQSPLLRESLLVSFPPRNDMLKFWGYSPLKRGRHVCLRRCTHNRLLSFSVSNDNNDENAMCVVSTTSGEASYYSPLPLLLPSSPSSQIFFSLLLATTKTNTDTSTATTTRYSERLNPRRVVPVHKMSFYYTTTLEKNETIHRGA